MKDRNEIVSKSKAEFLHDHFRIPTFKPARREYRLDHAINMYKVYDKNHALLLALVGPRQRCGCSRTNAGQDQKRLAESWRLSLDVEIFQL